MRFLFLNQYAPPDLSPTARLLGELAHLLRESGHEVQIVSQNQTYRDRATSESGRLRREIRALMAIFFAGWSASRRKPDLILSLSSPPGLPVVAALLAWLRRVRLAHWAMDLYPELALALGEIKKGSLIARGVQIAMRWAYRRMALVVALDEDMRAHLQAYCRVQVQAMEPWSTQRIERQADDAAALGNGAAAGGNPSEPWVWLYSGNLGRAHEWQTLLESQSLLEKRGLPVHLIFQGDGAARPAAMAYAEKLWLRNCQWKGYVAAEELLPALLRANLLIVTQRPETRGLLWPSKLALLERLPRPVLFVGPEEGAIARRLRERGNAGVFVPGQARAIAQWIEDLFQGKINWDHRQARPLPTLTEQSGHLQRWLLECVHRPSTPR